MAFRILSAAAAMLLASTSLAHADFIVVPLAYLLFAGPLGAVASFGAIYTGLQFIDWSVKK